MRDLHRAGQFRRPARRQTAPAFDERNPAFAQASAGSRQQHVLSLQDPRGQVSSVSRPHGTAAWAMIAPPSTALETK